MNDSDIPLAVAGEETIIRAIKKPDHYDPAKSGKLKPYAFRPRAGHDDLSVMRHNYLGTEGCREKSKQICKEDYVGMASLLVSAVREIGSNVVDTREVFLGHADMPHGYVFVPNEPPPPEIALKIKEIVAHAVLHLDPDVKAATWTGANLRR